MITLGKMIYKLTGYMTKKELVRNARAVGKQACTRMQETGRNLSSTEISEILSGVIGKKGAAKIEISGDKASLVDAIVKNFGFTKSSAEMVANNCLSAALGKGVGNKTHLNIQVSNMPMHKSVNIIPHETEHALHRTFSFNMLFTKFLEKTSLGRKYLQKMMTKSEMINDKNLRLQGNLMNLTGWNDAAGGIALEKARTDALFEVTKCSDIQILREQIKKILYEMKVLEIGNDKQNNFVLKQLIPGLADESRAYNAGSAVEKFYKQTVENASQIGTTKSEVVADIYDEAVQIMKKERRHIQKNRLREFFGLKANRQAEQEIVDALKARLEESRVCAIKNTLQLYRGKHLSAEECKMCLKDFGLNSKDIENAMKEIFLEA